MNHLESFLEPFLNARWGSLSNDEKNSIVYGTNYRPESTLDKSDTGKYVVC